MVPEAGVVVDSEKTITISEWLKPKRYKDLKCYYHWPSAKKDVSTFVSQWQTCQMVKAEHQVPCSLL